MVRQRHVFCSGLNDRPDGARGRQPRRAPGERGSSRGLAALALLGALGAAVPALCAIPRTQSSPGEFTVRDSVRVAYFGNLWSSFPRNGGEDGVYSPDGRYYARVTSRANLREGCIESTVWLIDTRSVAKYLRTGRGADFPKPRALARMCDDGGGDTVDVDGEYIGESIDQLSWGDSGKVLGFRGSHDSGARSIFVVALKDGSIRRVTPVRQNVISYQWARGQWVYLTRPLSEGKSPVWLSVGDAIPNAQMITGESLIQALYPNAMQHVGISTQGELWQTRGEGAHPVIDPDSHRVITVALSSGSARPALSVVGNEVVLTGYALTAPSGWKAYRRGPLYRRLAKGSKHARRSTSVGGYGGHYISREEYLRIDLTTGRTEPLLDAPVADFGMGWRPSGAQIAAWSRDGRYVAVVYTYLSVKNDPADRERLKRPCIVAVVSESSGRSECVWKYTRGMKGRFPYIYDLKWTQGDQSLLVTQRLGESQADELQAYEHRLYSDSSHGWRLRSTWRECAPNASSRLALGVRQGFNDPPKLIAEECGSGRTVRLLDPNPWLQHVALGQASLYRWGAKGRYEGVLVEPPALVRGRRYPLVVQTHGFVPGKFIDSGYLTTGGAARALAARGIVVLQVRETLSALLTTRETDEAVDEYLAAIDSLSGAGLIDSSLVGITGFSRTGPYVGAAITRYPKRFAAAVLTNTEPGTMFGYLTFVDFGGPELRGDFANVVGAGGPPWGKGLEQWIEYAPGFRTEAVQAPVLFSAGDPQHLIALWGFYAALRDQGKPVAFQYIRDGQHMLTKPNDRLEQQRKIVQWYDSWLNSPRPRAAGNMSRG